MCIALICCYSNFYMFSTWTNIVKHVVTIIPPCPVKSVFNLAMLPLTGSCKHCQVSQYFTSSFFFYDWSPTHSGVFMPQCAWVNAEIKEYYNPFMQLLNPEGNKNDTILWNLMYKFDFFFFNITLKIVMPLIKHHSLMTWSNLTDFSYWKYRKVK